MEIILIVNRSVLEPEPPNSKLQTQKKLQTSGLNKRYRIAFELGNVLERGIPALLCRRMLKPAAEFILCRAAAAISLLLCASTFAATPGTTNSLPPGNVDAWSIIPKRNIFNSRRSPAYVPTQRESRPVSRVESFALVGTMDYDKGPLAFFDGNRSDFRKVVKPDDTIAGFKVLDIEPKFVKLAGPTNTLELGLGMQLRRENSGEWSMSERPESLEPRPAPSPSAHLTYQTNTPAATNSFGAIGELLTGLANGELPNFPQEPSALGPGGQPPSPNTMATNSPPEASSGGSESDVLQRLMRRRQQENQ